MKIRRTDVERMLILCAAALVVALALRSGSQSAQSLYEEPLDQIPVAATATQEPTEKMNTVVYYQDGDGYLVPVTRTVPKTEGIAKATLDLMVKSSANDMQAARLGLQTVIPEGTSFDVDIAQGKARVDLSEEALSCANAEQESVMVAAVVHAMTTFSTVDEVELLFDGQKRSKLTYGTDVSAAFSEGGINMESVETMAEGARQVQLYFPSQSGRMLVPVTRTVYSDADMTTALLELVKGPRDDSGLEAPLPKDCGLKGVTMKDGVVTINFSQEFMNAMEGESRKAALQAITFTASQFPGVKQVKLQVEGKEYAPPAEDAPTFLNSAEEIMTQYPGVIEID